MLEPITESLCSVAAAGARQDPIGSVLHTQALLFVETATPWANDFYDANPAGSLYQRIRAVQLDVLQARVPAGSPASSSGFRGVYGIAPDAARSLAGSRRVIAVSAPPGPFATYSLAEYAFPEESFAPVELVRAHLGDPPAMSAFDRYLLPDVPERELFVCTHGQVDICCARFGIPAYQALRSQPRVRAWRTSHFGGHRFAPTMKDFPSGYTWAFLDEAGIRQIVSRQGPVEPLLSKMRGWSGVPGAVQLLDREGFQRYGWKWMDFQRHGEVLAEDLEAKRWRVLLDFSSDDGRVGRYEGVVGVRRTLLDPSCGTRPRQHAYESPEYFLESFRS